MSIIFLKAPKEIDFTGNGLRFDLQGDYETTPGVAAFITLTLSGSLTNDSFSFYDFEKQSAFTIATATTPNPEANEIENGLSSTLAIVEALNSIAQFRKYYCALYINTSFFQIYRLDKGFFFWLGNCSFPACFSTGTPNNGTDRVVKSNYTIFGLLSKTDSGYVDNKIAEFNFDVTSEGKALNITLGEILKSYIDIYLPTWYNTFYFDIKKFIFDIGEKYDVDGVNHTNRFYKNILYALRGKLSKEDFFNNPDYDLLSEILFNRIFLNTFKVIEIFKDAHYVLNFININSANEVVKVRCKIYYTDGTNETKQIYTISTIPKYRVYGFRADPVKMDLYSYSPTKEIYKYEVWVEHANSSILCSPVTFRIKDAPSFYKQFAFLNKFGCIEYFQAISKESISLQIDKTIVKKSDDTTEDSFITARNQFKVSTGSLTRTQAIELQYMLMSEGLYEIVGENYVRLIIESNSINIIEESADVSTIEFTYRKNYDL